MTRELRVALLGGGKMAVQHAAAIRHCGGAKLVAVADPALQPSELQARFGADVTPFADLESMLDEAKPDVVHIVTPPATHAPLAKACLTADVHVYVEKPFALTTADAESILALAATKGLQACAAHQVLFQEAARTFRPTLPLIGDVKHVESFFSFKPVRRRSGGGGLSTAVEQLIDILPHPVYLLLSALPAEGSAELTALDVSADGEVRAVVRRGDAMACLVVTLRARPIESYLRIMGTNGSVEADFVIGYVVRLLGPGASAPAVVLKPFSKAWQVGWGAFKGLLKLVFRRHKSYPGLAELLGQFYASIATDGRPPISGPEILDTVRLCEAISARLQAAELAAEQLAVTKLKRREGDIVPHPSPRGTVLLTGGTGMLGRPTAIALQRAGWTVRVPVRREVSARQRIPGVEYLRADLGDVVPDSLLDGVSLVVHAAAETAGDKSDHERNTIKATANLLDSMARSSVRRLINISSVAVLKPASFGQSLHEDTPIDLDNLGRGPYVWAKALAEQDARKRAEAGKIELRTIRLGPLIDYEAYTPPGRLGREVARLFVAMGGRRSRLAICSVATAAVVICSYAERFDQLPACVNLLEVPAPTRRALVDRLKTRRPDLKVLWLPFPILRLLSSLLRIVLKLRRPGSPALNLYAAFKSESYDPQVAASVIATTAANTGVDQAA